MQRFIIAAIAAPVLLMLATAAPAQVPVTAGKPQEELLKNADPVLARNKKLVYDFWREVLEAGHLDRVDLYLDDGYIQHNPITSTGKAGFLEHFTGILPRKSIEPKIVKEVVTLMAEDDLVILATVRHWPEPKGKGTYTTTAFDMFRIGGGKIVEHWDAGRKD